MHRYKHPGSPGKRFGRQRPRSAAAFSLLEIMIALAVVAVVLAVAVPAYQGYTVRAYRTQAQADLLQCAQGMERHAASTMGYGGAVDVDGDGRGDQSTGEVSENLCRTTSTRYRLSVRRADANHFVLRAQAVSATSLVAADGALELDATGERRWDRNADGDFDDADERGWEP